MRPQLHERVFSQNSTTPTKPNKALKAIRGWLTLARTNRGFDWNWTCEQNEHCRSQFMLSVKPCVYLTASKSNCSSVVLPDKPFQLHPANFFLICWVKCHLIRPQLLSLRDTLDLACAIFQYLFMAYLLYLCLNGYLSTSWGTNGETRCGGKVSLLFLTSFIHLCHSFPSLRLSIVHALRSSCNLWWNTSYGR